MNPLSPPDRRLAAGCVYPCKTEVRGAGFVTVVVALLAAVLAAVLPVHAWARDPVTPVPGRRHQAAEARDARTGRTVPAVADEIVVRFRPGRTNADNDNTILRLGGSRLRESRALRTVRLRIPPGRTVAEVLARYAGDPDVELAEPNYLASVLWIPDDEHYHSQWGLPAVRMPEAWDLGTGGADVIIAVLDSGLDLNHPDLVGQWLPGSDLVNDDDDPSDDYGHGTRVAGIIAARANNGIGIAGVAPGCRLLPVKVVDAGGAASYADVAEAIIFAADRGARVINLSLGGYAFSQVLQDAVDYARARGCVLVAAGGNQGILSPVYPAACNGVLGVSSIAENSVISVFANSGGHIDVCAPGENITSLDLGGGIVTGLRGTSFAAPFVSGLAALAVSRDSSLTANEVAGRIVGNATDLGAAGRDDNYGYGFVAAHATLTIAGSAPPPPDPVFGRIDYVTRTRLMTDAEFALIRNSEGTYEEGRNYNRVFGTGSAARGTGLQPPRAEDWDELRPQLRLAEEVALMTAGVKVMAPDSCDNSASKYFPPIGNQGAEGSCVSWTTAYYIKTFHEALEHDWDLSGAAWNNYPTYGYWDKIMSPDFLYHLINGGVDNGSNYVDNVAVVRYLGASTWENMPNDATNFTTWPSEMAWREAPLYRGQSGLTSIITTTDTGITNVKNLLAGNNLAILRVNADSFPQLSSDSDLWTKDNYAPFGYNHGNTIVGYDDNFGPYTESGAQRYGAFKVANSWGLGPWPGGGGDTSGDGFYWISYLALKSYPGYVYYYTDTTNYSPTLLARLQLAHARRGECRISIVTGDTQSPTAAKLCLPQTTFSDANPFPTGLTLFDITELRGAVLPDSFHLRVYDDTTPTGTITAFGIETYQIYNKNGNADSVYLSTQVPRATTYLETVYVTVVRDTDYKNYTTWYVNDGSTAGDSWCSAVGDDANSGYSPAAPKRTFAAVIPFLTPGDTVYVDSGTYAETVIISVDNLTFIGVDSASTVIDARDSSATRKVPGILIQACAGLRLCNLRVTNAYYGIQAVNLVNSTLQQVRLDHNYHGLFLQDGTSGCTVSGLTAETNAGVGITLKYTHDNLISGCLTTGNTDDGFNLNNDYRDTVTGCSAVANLDMGIVFNIADSCIITNNLISGNGDDGMYTNQGFNGGIIANNLITGNADYGLFFTTTCRNSTISGNTSSGNADDGFYFWNDEGGNIISGNISSGNTGEGFYVRGDFSNTVFRDNVSHANVNNGFYIWSATTGNTFRNNVATRNKDNGFYLNTADSQMLFGNSAEHNDDYQVRLNLCNSGTVQKNNFRPSDTNPAMGVNSGAFAVIDLTRNWWGGTDTAAIAALISGSQQVLWTPFRLGPVDTAAGADTIAPAAPATVSALISGGACTIVWSASSTNEEIGGGAPGDLAGYRVYRSSTSGTTYWAPIGTTAAGDLDYYDASVPGGSVYYRVTAYDNHAPWPNESWYSDIATAVDVSGPNAWYINAATGDTANLGLSVAAPKKYLSHVFAGRDRSQSSLSAGDTVHIAAGTYTETFAIDADYIWVLGADSATTIIDYGDSSAATRANGCTAAGRTGIVVRDLTIANCFWALHWYNVDNSRLERLTLRSCASSALTLDVSGGDGCDSVVIDRVSLLNNNSGGLYLSSGYNCTVRYSYAGYSQGLGSNNNGFYVMSADSITLHDNLSEGHNGSGFIFGNSADSCLVRNNISRNNTQEGYHLVTTRWCRLEDNLSSGNAKAGYLLRSSSHWSSMQRNIARGDSAGFVIDASNGVLVTQNTVDSCANYAFWLRNGASGCSLPRNNVVRSQLNPDSGAINTTAEMLDARRSWWGTTDSAVLDRLRQGLGADSVLLVPYRLGAIDTTAYADTAAPAAPASVTVTGTGALACTIAWSVSATNEEIGGGAPGDLAGYRVYRSMTADTNWWRPLGTTTDTSYTDTGVNYGDTYYYRITAYDNHSPYPNESWYSDSVAMAKISWKPGDFADTGASAGVVDSADLLWLKTQTVLYWGAAPADNRTDLNGDGKLDFEDIAEFARLYGQ